MAPLRRLAWSYARDEFEDLFQEIATALWTALPGFRGESSERTWVYRVAHNTAISFVVERKRRGGREAADEEAPEPMSETNPERDAIKRQQRIRLWTAVLALPLPERQLVVLHLEGLAAAEIGAVTGLSHGAVATRLTRIRQRLAATIQGEEGRS
jgi:RNA polymerase sigma-70 factor (ECF subfamily)